MSDQTQSSNQRNIVIALGVVAILLAAIVAVLIYQQTQASKLPTPTAQIPAGAATAGGAAQNPAANTAPAGSGAAAGQAPAGMGAAAGQAPAAFDEKTSTKAPAGMTPEQVVKAYNEDVIAGKYAAAYAMLPVDKQQSYGSASAYEQQVKAYGITSYNMGKPTTSGDTVTVVAEQVTPQMPITYTWTFKKVGNQWYVVSRTMGGSVN